MLSWFLCATVVIGSETEPIVIVKPPDDFSLSPGESKEAKIRITVTDGFHVQANPAANRFLVPLTLEFENEKDLEIGEIRYPEAETYRIKGTEQDLLTYGGTFTVSVSIRASESAKEGISKMGGRLRYQACDDRACRAPATLAFDLAAQVYSAPEQ
jgi:hypothetical protein